MSCRITVRVQPGARRSEIAGYQGGDLRVRVTAAPEKGKANQAVLALLAERLGLPMSAMRVVRGASSRSKTIEIEGLTAEEVARRLDVPG